MMFETAIPAYSMQGEKINFRLAFTKLVCRQI